ncbi:reverse transcriptase family protein, partial [Trichuris trichiura]
RSKNVRSSPVSSARKNATNKRVSANTLRHKVSDSLTDAYREDSILFVTSNRQKKTSTTVIINNVPCRMEDSGSDFMVISKETYRSLWKSTGPPIEPCRLRLVDFQRRVVPLAGFCTVDVSYGRHKGHLRLYVAKGRRTGLLGSDWFETLGIRLVGIHHIDSDPIGHVLTEFADVFGHDNLGAYKGPPVHLQLDPSVKPIQMKARRVPVASVFKIDAEIDRLIRHGVLEPSENVAWATPVVPVMKRRGSPMF